jgi:hypothetical protein
VALTTTSTRVGEWPRYGEPAVAAAVKEATAVSTIPMACVIFTIHSFATVVA